MAPTPANPNGQDLTQTNKPRIENKGTNINSIPETPNSKRARHESNEKTEKYCDELYEQLQNERKNNSEIKKDLKEMRKQLSALTETINKLNITIENLQKENKKLSTKSNGKKNHENKTKVSTKISTNEIKKTTETDATNTQASTSQVQASTTIDDMDVSVELTSDETNAKSLSQMQTKKIESNEHKTSVDNHTDDSEDSDNDNNDTNYEDGDNTNNEDRESEQIFAPHTNEKIKRSSKIPPVDVWTQNQQATQQLIRMQMPQHSCVFTKVNKSKMRIIANSIDIRLKLIELLKQREIAFNTYTPTSEKMINVLLKGTEVDDKSTIELTLKENGIQPHKINRFSTGYMRKNAIQSNIWQIVLLPHTDVTAVMNIKYIAEWSVKWELMKKPQVTQCRRCQRFFHSASNCTLPYRCVKCVNTHAPGNCPLDTSNNKTTPICVNCNGNHTANNALECQSFQRAIELMESKRDDAKTNTRTTKMKTNNANSKPIHTKPIQTSSRTTHKTSYASAAKKNVTQPKNTEQKSQHMDMNNFNEIISQNQKQMLQMFQQMMNTQNELFKSFLMSNVRK